MAAWAGKAKIVTRRDCKSKAYIDKFRDVAPRARWFPEARWFDNVKSIGYGQFQWCDIVKVLLPDSIETFDGEWQFRSCHNLTDIGELPRLAALPGHSFYDCTSLALTSLPDGVTTIGSEAFRNCTSLALTSLPDGVTTIEHWAFRNCYNFIIKEIPDGVTRIGSEAFRSCTGIGNVKVLPTTPPTASSSIFLGCNVKLYVPDESVEAYKAADGWRSYADVIRPLSEWEEAE